MGDSKGRDYCWLTHTQGCDCPDRPINDTYQSANLGRECAGFRPGQMGSSRPSLIKPFCHGNLYTRASYVSWEDARYSRDKGNFGGTFQQLSI